MNYQLYKDVMGDASKRSAFNELAQQTFDLSFENWYQDGYWSESNIPYTLFDSHTAVSNISVNKFDVLWQGHVHHYIQLGTVMTHINYRNQGLSRFLMDEVMKDWASHQDGIFLFANKSVLDFYPRLGFEKALEYEYSTVIQTKTGTAKKLDMNTIQDRRLLEKYYKKTNPFSRLQVINNFGLLMFYCGSFMKDSIYYSPEDDAVIIANEDGEKLICFDVFCDQGKDLMNVLSSISTNKTKLAVLKFTPHENLSYQMTPLTNPDDTLFLLKGKENIFAKNKLMFPAISHT